MPSSSQEPSSVNKSLINVDGLWPMKMYRILKTINKDANDNDKEEIVTAKNHNNDNNNNIDSTSNNDSNNTNQSRDNRHNRTRRLGSSQQQNKPTVHHLTTILDFRAKNHPRYDKLTKFVYSRPEFLQLKTDDEIYVSADHQIRPIILPRDLTRLPWKTGYAECINAGKSARNEDQAACYQDIIVRKSALSECINDPTKSTTIDDQIPWFYYALFDGHAGPGVAVTAAAQLHEIISAKLNQISDILFAISLDEKQHHMEQYEEEEVAHNDEEPQQYTNFSHDPELSIPNMIDLHRHGINEESLIKGVLESAFWEMDNIIAHDKQIYKMSGGCTALVSLFILGKLYVCNAGDSRAIVSKREEGVIEMSHDFTPTTERQRILRLGLQRPELLGNEYTHLQFAKKPSRKDLGKQMLYKDAYMTGWSLKTITYDDLKVPLIWGEGKRSRVLATIGVTRGFGDHELKATYGSLAIKPFLTPEPQIKVLPLVGETADGKQDSIDNSLSSDDILIMATDGLWDNINNDEAAHIVQESFDHFSSNEESRTKYRYVTAAQDLVINSRGHSSGWKGCWRTEDGYMASLDDISVFVIPLQQYAKDYLEWKELRLQARLNINHKL